MKSARRSGIRRWTRLGCGISLVLLPLPFLSYLLYCNQPLPAPPPPPAPPTPNGFVAAQEALEKIHPSPDGSPLARREFTNARILRQKLAPDLEGLSQLRRSLRQTWAPPYVQDLSQDFPYLPRFRDAARKFAAQSRLALSEGRSAAAMDAALDAVELGSRLGQNAPLIHGLAAMSCASIGVDQAERCVSGLSADEARRFRTRLEEIMARYPTAPRSLDEERRVALSTLRKVFRNELDTQLLAGGLPRKPNRAPPPWYLYPKPWAYREMDRGFRAYAAEAAKPVAARQPIRPTREIMSRLLLKPLAGVLGSFDTNLAALQLLRLELALQEYRERQQHYPATLTELGPQMAGTAVLDGFSGKPFIYRVVGEKYLLYSVGPNLKDDGGIPEKHGKTEEVDLVAGKLNP